MRTGRASPIWIGISLLLALAAVVVCALALGLGVWTSRASLGQVGPADTPTALPPPTAVTPGSARPPEAGVQPASSVSGLAGLPADVPIPEGINPHSFVGNANQFSFMTDLSYAAVREFYELQLDDLGWTQIPYGTRIGASSAELRYQKEARTLTVRIVKMAFVGLLVEISLLA